MRLTSLYESWDRERKEKDKMMGSYYHFLDIIAKGDQDFLLSIIKKKFPDIPDDVFFVSDYGKITLQDNTYYYYRFNPEISLESNVIFKHIQKNKFVHRKWNFWDDISPIQREFKGQPNPFPQYLLVAIFQYCRSYDLLNCRLVCKAWRDAGSHDHIWNPRLWRLGIQNQVGFRAFLSLNRNIESQQSILHMARCWIYHKLPQYYDVLVPLLQCETSKERCVETYSIYLLMHHQYDMEINPVWEDVSVVRNAKRRKFVYIRDEDKIYTIVWTNQSHECLQYWRNSRDYSQQKNWPNDKMMFEFSDTIK